MLKILLVLAVSLAVGALFGGLTATQAGLPVGPGVLGFLLLVAAAVAVKASWRRKRLALGDEPGWPEQEAWHSLVATAMICGYLLAALAVVGFEFEMHSELGHQIGLQSWILIAGGLASYFIIRDRAALRDERDEQHAAFARRAGSLALVLLLVLVILLLAFGPAEMVARLTPPLLAQSLIVVLVVAALVRYVAQLVMYRHDTLA